jgi:hypothetical protein
VPCRCGVLLLSYHPPKKPPTRRPREFRLEVPRNTVAPPRLG